MWNTLSLYHSCSHEPIADGTFVWQTCLRQIHFLAPGEQRDFTMQKFSGLDAHRFLVEICSGLHSPLLGETEIFGQFRDFRERTPLPFAWNSLLNAVEQDARKVRRELLTKLGPQNYGSLIRKHLFPNSVVLVGAGRLAQELLPWLSEHEVYCFARNKEKAENLLPGTKIFSSSENLPPKAIWILAAPIENEELELAWKDPTLVLDMRGEKSFTTLDFPYHSLSSLFRELESSRSFIDRQKIVALRRVRELSHERAESVQHRPFGWEDVFA